MNTFKNVCYGFRHILATWYIHWCYSSWTNVYSFRSLFLLLYLGYKMTLNPPFTSVICDYLLTKHLTHMTYISRPLVRKFLTLEKDILIYLNFTIFQTGYRNGSILTPNFLLTIYSENITLRHCFRSSILPDEMFNNFAGWFCIKQRHIQVDILVISKLCKNLYVYIT